MLICIKQHLSNIWSSIHKKVSNTEVELKKGVAYKNACNRNENEDKNEKQITYIHGII